MRNPFQEALIAFIVICQMAFNLVTNDVFFEFLHTIYPSISEILPSSGNTIRGWIIDAFEARKEKVKQALEKSCSLIHFSFDLWTSPNHMALLGVIAHFIDEVWSELIGKFCLLYTRLLGTLRTSYFIFLIRHATNLGYSYSI